MTVRTALMLVLTLAGLLILGPVASAQNLDDTSLLGTEVTLKLTNGDSLSGTLMDSTADEVVLKHALLGTLHIPRTSIQHEAEESAAPATEAPIEPKSPWSGSVDGRLNGATGNTREHKYGGSLNLKHEDEKTISTVFAIMNRERNYQNSDTPPTTHRKGNTTKNQVYARYRREWKIVDSRWSPFWQIADEIDENKSFNHRLETAAGVGYQFIDEADERLTGRLGAGASKKFGADDEDEWVYEALLGVSYSLDLTPTNHLMLESTFFPSINNLGDYRTYSIGEWRFDMAEPGDWYFKIGASHIYDAPADAGDKRTDVNYYAGVGTTF